MRKPRLVFMQKSRKNREIALLFSKRGDGRQRGDGSAWSAAEAPQVRFYSVRNDTKRFSDGCIPTCISREVDGEEGGQ